MNIALIFAGGTGTRMHSQDKPKQFLDVNGKSIIIHTMEHFEKHPEIHIDHQEVVKAAMVALRPVDNLQLKAIYAYETLSETEWNTPSVDNAFIPNCYNDITEFIEVKKQAMECFQTQIKEFPHPRSIKAIDALATLRGSTICTSYAEAFMCIREILGGNTVS